MNDLQARIRMGDLVEAVRESLVMARVLRQEAEHIEAYNALYDPVDARDRMSIEMRDQARMYRLQARDKLIRLEKINGSRYLRGKETMSLRRHIRGKYFRLWHCYRHIYKSSKWFHGVDPQ